MLQFHFVSEQIEALTACVEACVAYKHLMRNLRDIPNDQLHVKLRDALTAMNRSWSVLDDAHQDLNIAMLRTAGHNEPLAVIEVMLLHACVKELGFFVGQAHTCCEPLIEDALAAPDRSTKNDPESEPPDHPAYIMSRMMPK